MDSNTLVKKIMYNIIENKDTNILNQLCELLKNNKYRIWIVFNENRFIRY